MEDEKKSVLSAINPKKKAAAPKKPAQDKDAEATAKVQQLLKGTSVASLVGAENAQQETKPQYDVEELKQEKSSKWLEGQVELLSKQIEEYENEIIFYKNEIQRLQANTGTEQVSVANQELSPNLIAIFRHFEQVYMNGYTDAKIAHAESGNGILDKLQQYFPQLQNVRNYRYRGQGR